MLKPIVGQGKDYLLCDYNRDGDSYRSPWSNEYDPPIEDGSIPSDKTRKFEVRNKNNLRFITQDCPEFNCHVVDLHSGP